MERTILDLCRDILEDARPKADGSLSSSRNLFTFDMAVEELARAIETGLTDETTLGLTQAGIDLALTIKEQVIHDFD